MQSGLRQWGVFHQDESLAKVCGSILSDSICYNRRLLQASPGQEFLYNSFVYSLRSCQLEKSSFYCSVQDSVCCISALALNEMKTRLSSICKIHR